MCFLLLAAQKDPRQAASMQSMHQGKQYPNMASVRPNVLWLLPFEQTMTRRDRSWDHGNNKSRDGSRDVNVSTHTSERNYKADSSAWWSRRSNSTAARHPCELRGASAPQLWSPFIWPRFSDLPVIKLAPSPHAMMTFGASSGWNSAAEKSRNCWAHWAEVSYSSWKPEILYLKRINTSNWKYWLSRRCSAPVPSSPNAASNPSPWFLPDIQHWVANVTIPYHLIPKYELSRLILLRRAQTKRRTILTKEHWSRYVLGWSVSW